MWMKRILCFLIVISAFLLLYADTDIHDWEEKLEAAQPNERFELLTYLANAYLYDNISKSIDYANRALEIAKINDNKNQIILSYNILASAYTLLGDDISSASYMEKAFSIQMGYLSPQDSILQQITEIRRDREIKELELANKDILLSKQKKTSCFPNRKAFKHIISSLLFWLLYLPV
jgi:hypothetical protein